MSKGQWASPKSISRKLGVNVQNLDLSSKNKIGEEFSISQGLIKIVWKYAGEMISKKSVREDEKKQWKAIKRMILARMEEVFPDPAVKERYVKNLDKGYFREIFAKGPVEKRTRKRKGTRKKQKKRGKTRRRK